MRQAIAEILGLSLETAIPRQPLRSESMHPEGTQRRMAPEPVDVAPATASRSWWSAPQQRAAAAPMQRRMPHLRASSARQLPDDPAPPQWIERIDPLRAADPRGTQQPRRPPSLLLPRWTPGVLQIMLATAAEGREVDLVRATEVLARQETLITLPRRHEASLRRGVQLLVDAGEAMLPHGFDEVDVAGHVRRVIGQDAVELLHFAGTPLRGVGRASRSGWERYEPPRQPRPILILSDLGIRRTLDDESALPDEWMRFVEVARAARCPIVALVPYRRRRAPESLRGAMHVVPWDRTTTVASVRRVIGGLLGVI